MITILGPTAAGKTTLAANLAYLLNGEVISADSRQVYRGMNIGTGKDYDDYIVNNTRIPFHLIDIVDPGYEYNIYEYQRDFLDVYHQISSRGNLPVLCGGTGLYLEAVLKEYDLLKVPVNKELRAELDLKSHNELTEILKSYGSLHNITDTEEKQRLIRAIEIKQYYYENRAKLLEFPKIPNIVFGIFFEREKIRQRITQRLKERLEHGMIDEVRGLLGKGLKPEQLIFYGLEYKFITQHLLGQISYEEMFGLLNTAIHQFSKRQMTWFRRMERSGINIHWIDGEKSLEEKLELVNELM